MPFIHKVFYGVDIFTGSCGSIVVCVSPLTALMMDQRAT